MNDLAYHTSSGFISALEIDVLGRAPRPEEWQKLIAYARELEVAQSSHLAEVKVTSKQGVSDAEIDSIWSLYFPPFYRSEFRNAARALERAILSHV